MIHTLFLTKPCHLGLHVSVIGVQHTNLDYAKQIALSEYEDYEIANIIEGCDPSDILKTFCQIRENYHKSNLERN